MRTVKLLLFLTSLVAFTVSKAQLSSYDFNGEAKLKFSARFAAINTLGLAEDSVKDLKAILIRPLELDKINHEKWGYQVSHRWAFVTEAFTLAVIDALNGGDFEWGTKKTSTSIQDFILGWHNHAWSAIYTDSYSISAGVHWGDYFLGFEPYDGNSYGTAREPAGWYGALGPVIMADVNVINKAVIHIEGSYAFTKKFRDFPDMVFDRDYPDPHFINLTMMIRSNSFIYGGMEYLRSVNRGSNPFNATRTDIFLGVWF